MRSLFSTFIILAVAALGMAAPQPAGDPQVFTARELAQGFRQNVVLARPLPGRRASVATDEAGEGIRVQATLERLGGLRILELPPGEDPATAIERLRRTGRYEFVEPDYIRHVAFAPDDPGYANDNLWGMKKIQADRAWDILREAPGIIVAVIDTGVNLEHRDLAGNLWQNPSPTIGDVNGIRYLAGTVSANPDDDNGHGTHVAGTIGAVGNNGLAVAGVAWRVQIMPIKTFPASGSGAVSDIVRGIHYAIDHGAHIINASYGEQGSDTFVPSASELAAIRAARDAGIIFVAAAGNAGLNLNTNQVYPAGHAVDNLVTVGNSTDRDELALSSNYGSVVDLFAPGSDILSLAHNANSGTATKSGTSMAAPHVSGALALLKARFPDETYRQLINRLLRGVDRGANFAGKSATGGRLNVFKALQTTTNRPFNDDFTERARLTGDNLKARSSTVGATSETGEPNHAGVPNTASLWWEWSPSVTGAVTVNTAGSVGDTVLAVYAGPAGAATMEQLTLVASNDDAAAGVLTSELTFPAQAGTVYHIAVAAKPGGAGLAALEIHTTPVNDLFSGAITLTGESARVVGHNANSGLEPGERKVFTSYGGRSLWYRWTAPRSGRFQISAVSVDFDPVLGVFTGSAVDALTRITENDNAGNGTVHTGSLCTIEAVAGTTYMIVVDTKRPDTTGEFTLTLVDSVWQAPTAASITGTPAVGPDGTIYFGSIDSSIYAYNPQGGLRWTQGTNGLIDTASPAIAADGSVYVGSNDGKLYAFTAAGARKWERNFGVTAPASNSPAIGPDGTVYIKAGDGYLHALDPANGSIRWSFNVHGPATYASPAVAADGTIYQGSDDHRMYAINPNGTQKWTFTTSDEIYTVPAIDSAGNIYFSVLNTGRLYSLAPDGTHRWTYTGASLGSSSSAALSPDGGTVYFAGYDRKLHAVDTATGTARWAYPLDNEVRASSPAVDADGVIYVGCYDGRLYAVAPDGTLRRTYDTGNWIRSSPALSGNRLYVGSNDGKLYAFDVPTGPASGPWPQYRQNSRRNGQALRPPVISEHPPSQAVTAGEAVTLSAAAASDVTWQWQRNGSDLAGQTAATLTLPALQPADSGIYQAWASNGFAVSTDPAVIGLLSTAKAVGEAAELRADIVHPNTNVYDQVQLHGAAAAITADPGQVVRMSFVDLSGDIVQVEFSGAGTLSLVLDNPSGPAPAENYVQPGVNYMRGHAGIVIAGADETTHARVFSVGRITAVDASLFRDEVAYDGMADLAFIAILSRNGRFGGLYTGNTSYFATRGLTGIYAPGVEFTGPVLVGDINAADTATPVLLLGHAADAAITGGDLLQANGSAVRVSGISALRFTAGTNSHGILQPAQSNRAQFEQNGVEVTGSIVVNP